MSHKLKRLGQASPLLCAMSLAMSPMTTLAAEGIGLEEIIITAQRKAESLQDVPIAVNAITGDNLIKMGLSSTDDLAQLVPAMTFAKQGSAGTPFIRGIGSNSGNPNDEPSVATYVDGVYIASPTANLMSINNLERVEVLKGPQGTLFGRNATGGVIQLITRDPSHDPVLEVSAGIGNYNSSSGSLYVSGGLSENVAADIIVQGSTQDKGYGQSTVTGKDIRENKDSSVRTKLVYTGESLTVKLAADYSELHDTDAQYTMPKGVLGIDGSLPPSDAFDSDGFHVLLGEPPKTITYQKGGSLHLSYDTDTLRFVSISSYREASGIYVADADATPLPAIEAELPYSQNNISQEFQVMSSGDSWLDWVAGVYIYRNEAGYDNGVFNGLAFDPGFAENTVGLVYSAWQEVKSESFYFQGTGEIFADTNMTLGVRYTQEEQTADSLLFGFLPVPYARERGYDEPTWRFAVDHQLNDDIMVYFSQNRGIKGGGFDLTSPGSVGYDPEELDAYEIGIKSELLDNTLRLNASYFYYDFKNLQVQIIPGGTEGGLAVTTNAAAASLHGLDVDFQYLPSNNLTISGGFAVMRSEYDEFEDTTSYFASPLQGAPQLIDASGNDTIRAPEFSGNLSVQYRFQSDMGEFPLTLTASHNGGFFFSPDERLEQDSYTLFNANLGWVSSDEQFSVTLWGKNLTDEEYWVQGVPSGFGDLVVTADPRTFGVTLSAKFGAY